MVKEEEKSPALISVFDFLPCSRTRADEGRACTALHVVSFVLLSQRGMAAKVYFWEAKWQNLYKPRCPSLITDSTSASNKCFTHHPNRPVFQLVIFMAQLCVLKKIMRVILCFSSDSDYAQGLQ